MKKSLAPKDRRRRASKPRHRAGLAAIVTLASASAVAQTTTENPELYFDVSTGLLASDNYEALRDPAGNSFLWESDLVLGYNSRTIESAIDVALGATIDLGSIAEYPDQIGDVKDPFFRLGYERENKSSFFDTNILVRQSDNKFKNELLPDFDSGDLVVSDGTRNDFLFDLALETGRGGPLTFDADLYYQARRFYDVTDSNQSDKNVGGARLEAGFAVSRTSQLLVVADYYLSDILDDTKVDETMVSLGLGYAAEVNKTLSFQGVVSYARDETTQPVGTDRVTTVQYEPVFDFSLVNVRPNGEARANLSSELRSTGLLTTLSFGRGFETKNGLLDFNIGATATESGNVGPVGDLVWLRENKRSLISLSMSSQLRVEDDTDEVLASRIQFNYQQNINSISGIRFNLGAAAVESFDEASADTRQGRVEVSYFRELTKDWELVAGYRYNQSGDLDEDPTVENRIFATIDRRFSWRP